MILYFVTRYETQLSGFSNGNILGSVAFPGLQTWELNTWMASQYIQDKYNGRNVTLLSATPFTNKPGVFNSFIDCQ
jgi:hypothetical protein